MSNDVNTKTGSIGLGLVALGIVYGDIGTSPLYALKAALAPIGETVTQNEILGVLSLIFWAMTLVVSLKYVTMVLRADNGGEGGILALSGLLDNWLKTNIKWKAFIGFLSVMGCALLLGDGMLTPAISVLSAVEGLKVLAPSLEHLIIPTTIIIILGLFIVQSRGTHRIAKIFGPIMLLWFVTIGLMGLWNALQMPVVFLALSPHYAFDFFITHTAISAAVFGAVFLVLTGGEALYADIGHCGGRIPVRNAWFTLVMPSLMLCYLGQGSIVLMDPSNMKNPFYSSFPSIILIPIILLATMATIIASQALISGVFTLARQAVQLGICPRLRIKQTSGGEIGQIYVPTVNWILAIGSIALVIGFGSSEKMAHAYGIAVSLTMLATTLLFCFVMLYVWNIKTWKVAIFGSFFLILETGFAVANLIKILDGGWVALMIAIIAFWFSHIWLTGSRAVRCALEQKTVPIEHMNEFFASHFVRTPGTEVFMTKTDKGLPPILCEYAKKTRSLAESVVILHFDTARVPYLRRRGNINIEDLGNNVWRVTACYGFMQTPRVNAALEEAEILGLPFKTDEALIVVGVETAHRFSKETNSEMETENNKSKSCLSPFSFFVYRFLSKMAPRATTSFKLPYSRVLEIGLYIKI